MHGLGNESMCLHDCVNSDIILVVAFFSLRRVKYYTNIMQK